jgi:hypothetical protein
VKVDNRVVGPDLRDLVDRAHGVDHKGLAIHVRPNDFLGNPVATTVSVQAIAELLQAVPTPGTTKLFLEYGPGAEHCGQRPSRLTKVEVL